MNIRDNITALVDAVIIHIFFIGILLFSVELPNTALPNQPSERTSIVNEDQVLAEIERLKNATEIKDAEQRSQQYALEIKKIETEQRLIQEQERLNTLQQQQSAERQRLETLKQHQQQTVEALTKLKQEQKQLKAEHNSD